MQINLTGIKGVTKKKNGTYLITIYCGYDFEDKQIKRTKIFKPDKNLTPTQNKKALLKAKVDFEEEVKQGQTLKGDIRFAKFADKWWKDYAEKRLADRTQMFYKSALGRIKKEIGHIRLDRLLPTHLNAFYDKLSQEGSNKKTGGALAPKTIREIHNIISCILNTAIKWQVIKENVADRADPPKSKRKDIQYLDDVGARQVIELLQNEEIKYKTAITLLIYSGFRRGELLGLKWCDVDFENGTISIRQTIQYTPEKGIFEKEPKTNTSARTIGLPHGAFILLKELKKHQLEERLKLADLWEDNDYLFTQWNGKAMHPDTLSSFFRKFVKRNNLKKGLHIHSLRHTNATLLIANNINPTTVSQMLGHAQTGTTMSIYAHPIQSMQARAVEVLGDILNPTAMAN